MKYLIPKTSELKANTQPGWLINLKLSNMCPRFTFNEILSWFFFLIKLLSTCWPISQITHNGIWLPADSSASGI